jgi:peptidoglycan hydrolase-like protein with peptidoglycan-binding domain
MPRKLFGLGARGEIIKEMQKVLAASGVDVKVLDGIYGHDTGLAVSSFQRTKNLPASGEVDEVTWQALMVRSVPSTLERSLQLTAAFEGHQFTLARGNFDGAWMTWGVIGFTMKSGNVPLIIRNVNANSPSSITKAFGERAPEILKIAGASREEQQSWAQAKTLPNGNLGEPWRSMFASFGADRAVQHEQLELANAGYMKPALRTAAVFGLKTELGVALCFDIHVQNGGIHSSARGAIERERGTITGEQELRVLIAKAVSDSALPKFRGDVLQRKTAIATGKGMVHGGQFNLESWGLGEYEADILSSK